MKTYDSQPQSDAILDKAFRSHPVLQDQAPRLEAIKERLHQAGRFLCKHTPFCDEQKEMIKALQLAEHWATQSILKNES